jgi:hypothetical protein
MEALSSAGTLISTYKTRLHRNPEHHSQNFDRFDVWRLWARGPEISTAVISALLSLKEHLSRIIHFAWTVCWTFRQSSRCYFPRSALPASQRCLRPDMFNVANTACVPNFATSQWIFLFGTCLSGYALLMLHVQQHFRYEVTFENEHAFCTWIHHVALAQLLRTWSE